MVNQHDVYTDDIEVGEMIGWTDRSGVAKNGIVTKHARDSASGVFHVSIGGTVAAVNPERIEWREVY